ncbi:MAG TPA: sulfurtransferase complex subunit TusB [Thermoplasmata archaeon]|nr:sulfurtransferase complex subunit TusB [Thermoplasmata archaeon]
MPKTAFLVLKSPQEQDPTHTIKRFADKADASTILVEDGVYQALVAKQADNLAKASHEVLVSSEDLEARGFLASDLKVGKAVGYPDIVDCIMERTERTITV